MSVGFGNRRTEALRKMANQSVSPNEAEIARRKLRAAEKDESWREAWADYKEHERIAERLAATAKEDAIAAIVKRWERGTFSGLNVRSGATQEARFRPTPSRPEPTAARLSATEET